MQINVHKRFQFGFELSNKSCTNSDTFSFRPVLVDISRTNAWGTNLSWCEHSEAAVGLFLSQAFFQCLIKTVKRIRSQGCEYKQQQTGFNQPANAK